MEFMHRCIIKKTIKIKHLFKAAPNNPPQSWKWMKMMCLLCKKKLVILIIVEILRKNQDKIET